MKTFLLKVTQVLLSLLVIMFIADFSYTAIYKNTAPRNKASLCLNTKNEKFKSIFLGSSRVENNINARLFDSLTGGRSFNFGMAGAGISESKLMLELLLANNNKIENVYLQVDHINYERSTANEKMVTVQFLPYINSNAILDTYFKTYDEEYNYLKYVPFYRYASNDSKLGFRELLNTVRGQCLFKKEELGYYPLQGIKQLKEQYKLPIMLKKQNSFLEQFKNLCAVNNINLILFTGPICSNTNTKNYFKLLFKRHPEIIDLTQNFTDDDFYNCSHTNEQGARKLTMKIFSITKSLNN